MKTARLTKFSYAAGLAALLLAIPFCYRSASANSIGQAAAQPADGAVTTTLADQSDLALTVYNSSLALVRDVRQLALKLPHLLVDGEHMHELLGRLLNLAHRRRHARKDQ